MSELPLRRVSDHFPGDERAVRVLEARSEEEVRTGADEVARLGVDVAEGHRPD